MAPFLGQAAAFLKQPTRRARVGVLGDYGLDRYVRGHVERISPEAPVPVLCVEERFDRLGCAANVVANLAALENYFQPELMAFGVVGNDDTSRRILDGLSSLSSRLRLEMVQDPTRPGTLKTRYMAGAQHQLLRVDEESTQPLSSVTAHELVARLKSRLSEMDVLIVQDYAKGVLTREVLEQVFAAARAAKVLTLVDPNPRVPAAHYAGAGLITPNVAESESFLSRPLAKGRDSLLVEGACRELKEKLRLQGCVITRSAHGMSWLTAAGNVLHFPAVAREVYDVTGAGDTVAAVLGLSLAAGASEEVAGTLATAAASVVVAKLGTATASGREIEGELQKLG